MTEKNGKKSKISFITNGTVLSLFKDNTMESLTSGNDPQACINVIDAFKRIYY